MLQRVRHTLSHYRIRHHGLRRVGHGDSLRRIYRIHLIVPVHLQLLAGRQQLLSCVRQRQLLRRNVSNSQLLRAVRQRRQLLRCVGQRQLLRLRRQLLRGGGQLLRRQLLRIVRDRQLLRLRSELLRSARQRELLIGDVLGL